MAIAAPRLHDVDLLVLSDLRLGATTARVETLLLYLAHVQVRTVILLGSPLAAGIESPAQLPTAHLALWTMIGQLAERGTRVYCLERPGLAFANVAAGSATGRGIEFRDELQLRVGGRQMLFVSRRVFAQHHRFDGLIDVVELISRPWAQRLERYRDRAFAKTLYALADDRRAEVIVHPYVSGVARPVDTSSVGSHAEVKAVGSWTMDGVVSAYVAGRWTSETVGAGSVVERVAA